MKYRKKPIKTYKLDNGELSKWLKSAELGSADIEEEVIQVNKGESCPCRDIFEETYEKYKEECDGDDLMYIPEFRHGYEVMMELKPFFESDIAQRFFCHFLTDLSCTREGLVYSDGLRFHEVSSVTLPHDVTAKQIKEAIEKSTHDHDYLYELGYERV